MDESTPLRNEWSTSTTMLKHLADSASSAAWSHLVGVFQPILVRHACRRGFAIGEAEEVAQRTLAEFSRCFLAGEYQRERGRLRDWLFGIARNQMAARRREMARAQRDGRSLDGIDEEEQTPDRHWESDWRDGVVRLCLEQVASEIEPRTYEAFLAFAIRGEPAAAVAGRLGMTENAVFLGKRRVLELIRGRIAQMEQEI